MSESSPVPIGLVLAMSPRYSETFLASKVLGLRADGHDVRVFVGNGVREPGVYPGLGITKASPIRSSLLCIRAWMLLVVLRPRRVWRFIVSERKLGRRFDRILLMMAVYYPILMHARSGCLHFGFAALAVGAESLAEAVGSKMSVSLRGYDIVMYPLKHPHSYTHLWSKVEKVHTISDDLALAALRHRMPPSIPVMKITPAIDSDFFRRERPYVEVDGTFRILTVARLHWKKGIEYILMALQELIDTCPTTDWRYTIVGEGDELERLAFAASEMGLMEKVSFAGRQSPENVRRLFEQSDCYVQYSVQEGFCNAVLEAQAMELPCIVSDAEGLPENVGEHGTVVPRRQPQLLAKALMDLEKMSLESRKERGKAARQRVVAEFSLDQQRRAFTDFFEHD